MNIGAQYARFGAEPMRWDGLPRTFEEYVAKLYGPSGRNWMPGLNYGLLLAGMALAGMALVLAIVGVTR